MKNHIFHLMLVLSVIQTSTSMIFPWCGSVYKDQEKSEEVVKTEENDGTFVSRFERLIKKKKKDPNQPIHTDIGIQEQHMVSYF